MKNSGEIYSELTKDPGAGRRAGVIDLCDWSTCYINDRTKSLDLQGIRACLFCFIKYMGENMMRGENIAD